MKLIIISDINSRAESIIPYGLNLAKELTAEVHIVHPIDTRHQQGVHSPQSDSQSLTPGNKMSYAAIIGREKYTAKNKIGLLLSREASVLNYPLAINTHVKEGSLFETIYAITKDNEPYLILLNAIADNYVFQSQAEVLETAKHFNSCCMLIQPGEDFDEISKVLMVTDFNEESLSKLPHIALEPLSEKFNIKLEVVDIAKSSKVAQRLAVGKIWEKALKQSDIPFDVETKVVASDDYFWALKEYIQETKPDFVVPAKQSGKWFNGNSTLKISRKIIEHSQKLMLM